MTLRAICQTISFQALLVAGALFVFSSFAYTQLSDNISRVVANTPHTGEPLTVQADIINPAEVARTELAYRQFGQRDYKRIEMMLAGNTASASVPSSDVVPPFIEYYILIFFQSNRDSATYPRINPELQPLKAEVSGLSTTNEFVSVISPEENESVKNEDLLISFTVRDDSTIAVGSTRIHVDAADVSDRFLRSGNLFVLRPENSDLQLQGGHHVILVEVFGSDQKQLGQTQWTYTNPMRAQSLAGAGSEWLYTSSIQLETRNENIAHISVPYNRAAVVANATHDDYRFSGKLFVTNEEKEYRQPQHRLFFSAESPWLKLSIGDAYPQFSDLIMAGKRLRGFSGNLSIGSFGLDVASGQITRHVEGDTLKTFLQDSLNSEQSKDPAGTYVPYTTTASQSLWTKIRGGIFSRDILVVHPRFGKKDASHIGFTFLKSSDDASSIRYGVRPQENLVLGSDLLVTFGRRAVEISGQAAASATNKDIARGSFSDTDIDSIYKSPDFTETYRSNIKKVRDYLSKFITVNEHLIPLATKNMPTLSYEGSLTINAFDNAFQLTYLRHGNNYESFGQSAIRPDVIGYKISDRIRLVRNTLFVSGGFERLQDNTAETKPATTTSTTANIGVSYLPSSHFPDITIGYILAANTNEYPIDSLRTDDHTHRVLLQLSHPFTYYGRHQATLSINTSTRDDKAPRDFDVHSTNLNLGATSTFAIPLQTTFNASFNWNSFVTVDSHSKKSLVSRNYTMLYFHAEYRIIEDRLRFTGTLSPLFGDEALQRTMMSGGMQYFFTKNISVLMDAGIFLNGNHDNDIIGSLILRLDL